MDSALHHVSQAALVKSKSGAYGQPLKKLLSLCGLHVWVPNLYENRDSFSTTCSTSKESTPNFQDPVTYQGSRSTGRD